MPNLQDLRYGARMLARYRGFTAVAVASLALGLGANAAVFSVTNAVVLRDLPFPQPHQLVHLNEIDPAGTVWPLSAPDLADFRRDARQLTGLAGIVSVDRTLAGADGYRRVQSAAVTASLFPVLGITPVAGSVFGEEAERQGADTQVAVITRGFWAARFQASPGAVGQVLELDGERYTVVGVVDDLSDLLPGVQVLTPLGPSARRSRGAHEVDAIARLAPGVTTVQADAELDSLAADIARRTPATNAGWTVRVTDLKASILGPSVARMLWVQFGVVALFGLLACTNVAGLLLARGAERRRELAVRAALGASRGRIVRQLLVESALLAAIGGAIGLTLAAATVAEVRRMGPALLPRLADARLDGTAFGFTAALTVVAVAVFGLAPAVVAGLQPDIVSRIREGGRGTSGRQRGRAVLVAAQTAIAMTLLVGAGLVLKSFLALSAVDPGFDPTRVIAVHVMADRAGWSDARAVAVIDELTEQIGALSGVTAAGATNAPPFGGWNTAIRFRRADEPESAELRFGAWRTVTPGFFRALGLPLLRGRLLDARDTADAPDVIVVTETLASRVWPGEDAVGKQIVWGRTGAPKTVVGVVGDLRDQNLDRDPQPTMFRAHAQLPLPDVTVLVRVSGDPAPRFAELRRTATAVAPGVAIEIEPLDRAVDGVLVRPRANTALVAAFALLAVALAALGLYGIVSYGVRARQREIAIRVALGAIPRRILWTALSEALMLAAAGTLAGAFGGLAFSRALASLLYRTRPFDAGTYAAVVAVMAVVAIVAALVPARRVLGVDPVAVLRHE